MARLVLGLGLLSLLSGTVYPHPCPPHRKIENEYDTTVYFERLGYLETPHGGISEMPGDAWDWAVRRFQRLANVNVTGDLDPPTMAMLNKPRCGVRDVTDAERDAAFEEPVSRRRRFAVSEGRWPKTELTYRISQYTPDLPRDTVNSIIAQALRKWSSVTPLTFVLVPRGPVDLEIRFTAPRHSDDQPFDGPGGTLAHAFFPPTSVWDAPLAGDTHFDEAETWVDIDGATVPEGTALLCVAIHEIGHSLGLKHSDHADAIMWPWAGDCRADVELGQDDMAGIQHLYGPRHNKTTPSATPTTPLTTHTVSMTTTPDITTTKPHTTTIPFTTSKPGTTTRETNPTPPTTKTHTTRSSHTYTPTGPAPTEPTTTAPPVSTEDPCDVTVDAVTRAEDGFVYVFKGGLLYRRDQDGHVPRGFPRAMRDVFPGAPTTVTAAVTHRRQRGNGPHHRRHGRHGPGRHGRHGHERHGHDKKPHGRGAKATTYLFSGNQVWKYKYDRRRGFRLERRFPKTVSRVFPGVDAPVIDSAVVSVDNGDVYFFSGSDYWRHEGEGGRLAYTGYPYPWSDHPVFSALPSAPDAALLHDNHNYFFTGTTFYMWNGAEMAGPRNTRQVLDLCTSKNTRDL